MLSELLRIITPEALATAIRSNPAVVQSALQKFEAYAIFGQTLSTEQQLCISSNLNKISDYFKSELGKASLKNLVENFVTFTKPVEAIDLRAQIERELRAELNMSKK